MSDLFGEPLLDGLRTADGLVDEAEEEGLLTAIAAAGLTPFQFGPFEGKRRTKSFGLHYDFSLHRLIEAEPSPSWLQPLRERAAAFAGLPADALVHVLLVHYDAGTGIGWHKDRPQFDRVVGISLGASAELAFRRRRREGGFDRFRLTLAPRSAYLLSGAARHQWEHGISRHAEPRSSITFRSLAEQGSRTIGKAALAP